MMRRSRISVRPNVKPVGRALTASRDASAETVQPPQDPPDTTPSEGSEVTAERLKADPTVAASEQTNEEASQGSSTRDQQEDTRHGDRDASSKSSDAQDSAGTSVSSGPQRRKRFTALPNLAKPRAVPASSRTSKSPTKSSVKPATPSKPETPTPAAESPFQKPEPVPNPKIPKRRRPSGGGRQAKTQPIPTPSLQNEKETVLQTDGGLEDTAVPLNVQQEESQTLQTSQPDAVLVKENTLIPPTVDDIDIVVQQERDSGPTMEQSQTDLLKERLEKSQSSSKVLKSLKKLNDPSDMIRLAQARKLRELLKKEMNKEKEDKKKPKMGIKERKAPKDHAKMTMRELIYYLPVSNPMKSFTDEEQKTSEIVLDDSPTPTSSKTPDPPAVQEAPPEDAVPEEDEEEAEETQPEGEEPLLVPRVKVAEDGSLIIDEESLTVQVSRAKGPNPAEDRDPIFERGSTTTYSSFRKGTYTKPWSNGETEMFFLAISMVGTDFSMIGQLFPHRARLEIKNKFKKEEKNNAWRIDKAFKEKRRLDLDFFKTLMDQILEDEEKRKNKNKELVKMAKKQRRVRRKGRAKIPETDTSEDSDSDVVAGEKENEDLSNDAGSDIPRRSRGRRVNISRRGIKRTNRVDQPGDCENGTSEGQSQDDRLRESDSSENINKSPAIKPAQLKGRPQRPITNLSRGWGNRRPQSRVGLQEGRTSASDDQSNKVPSVAVQEKETDLLEFEDLDDEPELIAVQEQIFNKPTRSGRIPKLSQHVIQAAKEEEDEEELSELPTSSKVCQNIQAPGRRAKLKPGPRLKQGMPRTGKSRLVTLRASGTENDDEEEEEVENCVLSQEDFSSNPEEENQAFVPMSLRPLAPVSSEVVETMEELDISVNVPDILGTSQNALCPELTCAQASLPAAPVPCEHQLDLLVDVLDFLDPDHMEVCREINNEAAQTLLTIGNSAQMMQTSEIFCSSGNDVIEQSCIVDEEVVHEEIITETAIMSSPSASCDLEKSDIELLKCETHIPEPSAEESSTLKEETIKPQTNDAHPGPIQHDIQNLASASAPPPKRGRFSKPKPNIGHSLRTRQAPQLKISPEAVTDSLDTSKDPSSTEKEKNETQPTQEHSVPADQPSDSSAVHLEVLQPNTSSEGTEDIPKILSEEDKTSASSLKRKNEEIITEEKIKEQEDVRSEPQLTDSVSDSQSTTEEQSKSVRRARGPKPKPNLTQTSRQMRTLTKHSMPSVTTVTAEKPSLSTVTKSSEASAVITESNVCESTTQQEATPRVESAQAAVSEDESRVKTVVTLDENRSSPEEESNVKRSGCKAEDTPEEPVFILSLTEIPPTLDKRVDFRTEPIPPSGESKLDSHGQSANESKDVAHLLITDALVPMSEEQEKNSGEEDVDKSKKGPLKRKKTTSTSQENTKGESQAEHDVVQVLESPVAEATDEEHLEKKRKVPERTRRAKLQVKPIPVSRRNPRGVQPKEHTAVLSSNQSTSLHISTSQQTIPATISASNTDSDREAASENIHTPPQEKAPEESVQEGPSQGITGQVDIPEKQTSESASGSDTQGVSQITPLGTSAPLTRPGRRPKGFLSFISSKSTQGPAAARGSRPGPQKPSVNTTRPERKRTAATAANPTPIPASANEQNSEDEPTSVSKYFFSDIFTEVDELEDMD